MIAAQRRRAFRNMLVPGAGLLLPGVGNALTARIVADIGFEAAYLTGAGVANTLLGVPDIGLVTMTELLDQVVAVRDIYEGPLMVDADTGFGNVHNVMRATRLLERAGADALQLEDQVFPKRCGHFDGKMVIPAEEMVDKIRAAVDARESPDLLIVARTDAIATHGLAEALDRAEAYHEAGADVTFVEAPLSLTDLAQVPRRLPWPQLLNIVVGGRTPEPENAAVREMGFAGVIYANAALQASMLGMQEVMRHLRKEGDLRMGRTLLVDFEERQRLIGKHVFDELEDRFGTGAKGVAADLSGSD